MDPPSSLLPAAPSTFVGRARELEHLTALLHPERAERVVTVTGTAGVGKSRLLQQSAATVAPHYADGMVHVDLAAPLPDGNLIAVIALACGVVGAASATAGSLATALASRQLLLLIDHYEPLLDMTAQVVESLTAAAPRVRFCCAGREALHVPGEVVVPVGPLAIPESFARGAGFRSGGLPGDQALPSEAQGLSDDAEKFLGADAVRLFLARARAVVPEWTPDAEEAHAVASICRTVEGNPLAIERIATQIRDLSLRTVARQPASAETPWARIAADAVGRSDPLLGDGERLLLRRLSVFPDHFTLEAAEAICADQALPAPQIRNLLTVLMEKSLVLAESPAQGPSFRLPCHVRAFARDRLEASGEADERLRAHASWYAAVATRASSGLLTGESLRWAVRLDDEYENLRAAIRVLHKHSLAHAAEMAANLSNYLVWRKRDVEALAVADELLELNRTAQLDDVAALANLLKGVGLLWRNWPSDAFEALTRAQAAADRGGGASFRSQIRYMRAVAAFQSGHAALAEQLLEEMEARPSMETGPWHAAGVLRLRGSMAAAAGDFEQGLEYMRQSVQAFRQLGEPFGITSSLFALGRLEREAGRLARAAETMQEVRDSSLRVGNLAVERYAMYMLAEIEAEWGNLERAVYWYGAALKEVTLQGEPIGAWEVVRLSRVAVGARRWEVALYLFGALEQETAMAMHLPPAVARLAEEDRHRARQAVTPDVARDAATAGQEASPAEAIRYALRALGTAAPAVERTDAIGLRVLGTIEVRVGGRTIDAASWKYRHSRDILVYLACRGSATRHELGEALWPHAGPQQQRNRLNVCLYHLRKALGDGDWIQWSDNAYRLDPERRVECDLHEFERLVAAAERESAPPLQAYDAALALVTGEILGDMQEQEWARDERERMRMRIHRARYLAGQHALRVGDAEKAAHHFGRAIEDDPLDEACVEGFMRACALSGNLTLLVATFERFSYQLEEEMGVAPTASLRKIYGTLVTELGGYG